MKFALPGSFVALILALVSVANVRADEHSTFAVGNFTFTRPARWEWVEVASPFRKAQLKVTDAAANTNADVVFFVFAGGAGSVKANVERWHHQFVEPRTESNSKVEETTIGKTRVTYVTEEGTYNSGMPGGPTTPMADYALSGAIIEGNDGNIFVRMTGPKALVKSSVTDFKKMVESGLK
jgi:predicted peroxiredoxin